MIAIVDYNVGNLHSVISALTYLGIKTIVTGDKKDIERADAIILPGVGAFPDAMEELRKRDLIEFLKNQAQIKPFLGICLGMQMLFDKSYEFKVTEGLGLIEGEIVKIPDDQYLKIPHMGWNNLKIVNDSPLLKNVNSGDYVYFVHSYYAKVTNNEHLIATCNYGMDLTAIVQNKNVYGTQFHPEKSSDTGLQILKNFGELAK